MANKHLNPPNFCSTLDDLLPEPKRSRDTSELAKTIANLATGRTKERSESLKTQSGRKGRLKRGVAKRDA